MERMDSPGTHTKHLAAASPVTTSKHTPHVPAHSHITPTVGPRHHTDIIEWSDGVLQ